ncbi:MAG TPA: MATE family efflux transporter [Solimonas sp.]|nr:MATE family efflux transporter [Solimonas sp.]
MSAATFKDDFLREAPPLLKLALPLIAAQITFVSMGTVDTILAGRLGARQLAAVAVGTNLWFMLFVLFMGLFMACSPIVAQRVGGGRDAAGTGALVRGASLLALVAGLAWWLAMRVATGPMLDLLELDPETRGYALGYLHAVGWATVPYCLCFVLRNAAEGMGLTPVPLAAGVAGLVVNALSAWGLMYGKAGLPALGPAGAGWAMVLGALAMLATYVLEYLRRPALRALQVFRPGWPPWRAAVAEVLRLGGPIALILAAEAWLFMVGALMLARFGSDVIAAHQIAINFASVTFMVPLSVGLATTVRVGYAAGAGNRAEVRRRGLTGIAMGAAFALFSAALMALAPALIVSIYTDAATVAPLAARFLGFAALFQMFDCVQATANGALRGLKDTRMPMLITLTAYWGIGAPLAAGLAFRTAVGPAGIWWGFIAGLGAAALGLGWRFLSKTSPRRPVLMA